MAGTCAFHAFTLEASKHEFFLFLIWAQASVPSLRPEGGMHPFLGLKLKDWFLKYQLEIPKFLFSISSKKSWYFYHFLMFTIPAEFSCKIT